MTNLEKINRECGTNDTAEDIALEMILSDIEDDYDIEISHAARYVYVSAFHAKKAWLESEVEE